jgi:hypothetical protein
MGEQNALKVFSLTSTGPGMCNLTCGINVREFFHKLAHTASFITVTFGAAGLNLAGDVTIPASSWIEIGEARLSLTDAKPR